jgi:hypothetical protein
MTTGGHDERVKDYVHESGAYDISGQSELFAVSLTKTAGGIRTQYLQIVIPALF